MWAAVSSLKPTDCQRGDIRNKDRWKHTCCNCCDRNRGETLRNVLYIRKKPIIIGCRTFFVFVCRFCFILIWPFAVKRNSKRLTIPRRRCSFHSLHEKARMRVYERISTAATQWRPLWWSVVGFRCHSLLLFWVVSISHATRKCCVCLHIEGTVFVSTRYTLQNWRGLRVANTKKIKIKRQIGQATACTKYTKKIWVPCSLVGCPITFARSYRPTTCH